MATAIARIGATLTFENGKEVFRHSIIEWVRPS